MISIICVKLYIYSYAIYHEHIIYNNYKLKTRIPIQCTVAVPVFELNFFINNMFAYDFEERIKLFNE